ncbi:MAG: glutaredoxin family protein [Wenzhouxiangellaceae bacterium]|nr:glutaredoxin family protein [Wenzhouxiangellaceae bacterium]
MRLIFYTRQPCELCDKAYKLITVGGLADQVDIVDIETDLDLLQRYGDQVPVVRNPETGEKLTWPFTASQVRDLAGAD